MDCFGDNLSAYRGGEIAYNISKEKIHSIIKQIKENIK